MNMNDQTDPPTPLSVRPKLQNLKPPSFRARKRIWYFTCWALVFWFVVYCHSQWDTLRGDLMQITGFLIIIVGLFWSWHVSEDPKCVLSRWHDAAIINLDPEISKEISNRLHTILFRSQVTLALLLVSATTSAYTLIIGRYCVFSLSVAHSCVAISYHFVIGSLACSILVAFRLAWIAPFACLGRLLRSLRVPFELTIEHPDRAGGTTQIGKYFLSQALPLAIPIPWFAFWIITSRISTSEHFNSYGHWESYFLLLLLFSFASFIVAFLVPMLTFRSMMREWKRSHLGNRVRISRDELWSMRKKRELSLQDHERMHFLATQLDIMQQIPGFPISTAVLRNFLVIIGTFSLTVLLEIAKAVIE